MSDIGVFELFDELLDLEPAARAARLAQLDEAQPALAAELRRMLAADAATGGVLDGAPGVSRWDYVRVRRTVDRLKLTEHQLLAEERRKVWQKTAKLLDKYQRALANAATSAAARQEVKSAACEITSLTKPGSELSAVAKWCIRFSNQPGLQRLIA